MQTIIEHGHPKHQLGLRIVRIQIKGTAQFLLGLPFQRANKSDLIRVYNHNSCLMAEYREHWQSELATIG
jgi:hypothetical protein